MKQLFAHTPVDLMGFSFGGLTAGFIAAHYPELMQRLFLIGIPAYTALAQLVLG